MYGNSNNRTAEKSSAYKSPIKMEIEDDTANALREHVLLERELEDAKVNLAIKPDFNLFDAFKIFDLNSNGYIS